MAELTWIDTMRRPVTGTYHGVVITDDYRWLEDASSEETQMWTKAQHERTTSYLASLTPYREIRRRAEEVIAADSTSYAKLMAGGPTYFPPVPSIPSLGTVVAIEIERISGWEAAES